MIVNVLEDYYLVMTVWSAFEFESKIETTPELQPLQEVAEKVFKQEMEETGFKEFQEEREAKGFDLFAYLLDKKGYSDEEYIKTILTVSEETFYLNYNEHTENFEIYKLKNKKHN